MTATTSNDLAAEPPPRARRVLIVDDDCEQWLAISSFAFALDPMLELEFVGTADEARERLEGACRYDAVLADFLLADSDNGYQLRDAWRGEARRFAMMSSLPLEVPCEEPVEFLRKPFSGRECRRLLSRLLGA